MLLDDTGSVLVPDSIEYLNAIKYRILHAEMEKQLIHSASNTSLALAQQFGLLASQWTEKCISAYKTGPSNESEHALARAHVKGTLHGLGITPRAIRNYANTHIGKEDLWSIIK
jgi:hypothetical protein